MTISRCFVNICSDRVAETRDFYVNLLGFAVGFDSDWFVQLTAPDSEAAIGIVRRDHELVPEPFRAGSGGSFVTIVIDDVEPVYARAVESGVAVVAPPRDEILRPAATARDRPERLPRRRLKPHHRGRPAGGGTWRHRMTVGEPLALSGPVGDCAGHPRHRDRGPRAPGAAIPDVAAGHGACRLGPRHLLQVFTEATHQSTFTAVSGLVARPVDPPGGLGNRFDLDCVVMPDAAGGFEVVLVHGTDRFTGRWAADLVARYTALTAELACAPAGYLLNWSATNRGWLPDVPTG